MDLKQLHYFTNIVETRSFSKASAFLRIAQPALSRQIMLLEEELGIQLLVRHGRGVTATPAGALFAEHAIRLLKDAQIARDSVRTLADGPTGSVSLGVPSSLGLALLPDLVKTFRLTYPNVRLRVVEAFSATIHEWVLKGRLDLAVVYEEPVMPQLSVRALMQEPIVAVGPAGRFAPGSKIPLSDMTATPMVLPAAPNRLRLLAENAIKTPAGTPLEPVAEVDSLPVLLELVRIGVGCTILPYSAIHTLVHNGTLSFATFDGDVPMRRVAVARVATRPSTPATTALDDAIDALVHAKAGLYRWSPLRN